MRLSLRACHGRTWPVHLDDGRCVSVVFRLLHDPHHDAHRQSAAEKVQSVIGKFGERLTFSGTMEPDAYEKFLGLIFHYRQTIQVAGDAASDIAIRTQAIADFRDSNAYRCTDSIDFVNALVRSGAVTGRETLGDERKSKIETCVAELEAKLQAALKSESPSNIQPDARKPTLGVTPTRSLGPPHADRSGAVRSAARHRHGKG
jgi:hypothetical protein